MRVKKIYIPIDSIPALFVTGNKFEITKGLPENVKILDCQLNKMSKTISVVIESSEFEDLKDGETVPIFWPDFQRLD